MIIVLILFGGLIVAAAAALAAPSPLLSVLIGVVSGALMIVAGIVWSAAKPTYIDPVNRPSLITREHHFMMAGGMVLVGLFVLWVAQRIPAGHDLMRVAGTYFGGTALGVALGILATERKAREKHNRWLAAMSPQSDTEQ